MAEADITLSRMIKTFRLLFNPAATWERIDKEQLTPRQVLISFLLPWLLAGTVFEAACLMLFGYRGGPLGTTVRLPLSLVCRYELTAIILTLALVYGGALLLTRMGECFHSRHGFQSCFTTLSYSLSPLFVLRFFDGCPAINTWLCYGIGILLCVSFLYRGLPRTLRPEPSNALGMYLFLSVFLIIATGLAHYIGTLVLDERIFS